MPATFGRSVLAVVAVLAIGTPAESQTFAKLDPLLQSRVTDLAGSTRVIVRASDAASRAAATLLIEQLGGVPGRQLPIIEAIAAQVPNAALAALSDSSLVRRIALDRTVRGSLNRTSHTIGTNQITEQLGYDGSGVGVAVIDSGVTAWHDDLSESAGGQRVDAFVDFVNGGTTPYDDYGHGTHVAGIIAGNGFDSAGARAGVAPGARLVVLKVLDGSGRGCISDVIAAIGYAVEHRDAYRIRIINLSIGAGVFESYFSDLLTIAARRAVNRGIVVVASAGNFGKDSAGRTQYGAITAPGNAPWVLTVGASSHMGTIDRADDTVASFSSRGPTAIDRAAKPDLVAPGVGIESLSDPHSLLFTSKSRLLLNGTVQTSYAPYLSLSGTSQAAPVVAGVVALMLQANPSLTPNAVKAILQYTAETNPRYDALTQGAGFVAGRDAVELARYLGAPFAFTAPDPARWSSHLLWGNLRIRPGQPLASANAWDPSVPWGAMLTFAGQAVYWSVSTAPVAPSTSTVSIGGLTTLISPIVTATVASDNVVWGSLCGGSNCIGTDWSPSTTGVIATSDSGDTVVWGSSGEGDTVVWGSSGDGDTVVWGSSAEGDTVVWGSSGDEDVLWDSGDSADSGSAPGQVC